MGLAHANTWQFVEPTVTRNIRKMDLQLEIDDLLASNAIAQALDRLAEVVTDPDTTYEIALHKSKISSLEKLLRERNIDREEYQSGRARIVMAVQFITREVAQIAPVQSPKAKRISPQAFLSYSTKDRETVDQLRKGLEAQGISVVIDCESVVAGQNFSEFIRDSVRRTDVTVSVVSQSSLLSDWVAMESVFSFYANEASGRRQFIACYLDDCFLEESFRLVATKLIDKRIETIDSLIPEYIKERIDTIDLNEQKSRLFELRNGLGKILRHLRECLCVDIRGPSFETGLQRIAKAILYPLK